MYNFMLEYFWLGPQIGVASRAEYNSRRRTPIGAKNPVTPAHSVHEALLDLVDPQQIPEYRRGAALSYLDLMQSTLPKLLE